MAWEPFRLPIPGQKIVEQSGYGRTRRGTTPLLRGGRIMMIFYDKQQKSGNIGRNYRMADNRRYNPMARRADPGSVQIQA
jgi:hypothetical protein